MPQDSNGSAITSSEGVPLACNEPNVVKFNIQEDTADSDMINVQIYSQARRHLKIGPTVVYSASRLEGILLKHAFRVMVLTITELSCIPDTIETTLTYDSALSTDEINKKVERFLEQYNKLGNMYAKEHPEHKEKIFQLMKNITIKIETLSFENEFQWMQKQGRQPIQPIQPTRAIQSIQANTALAKTPHMTFERASKINCCIKRFNEQLALIANKAKNLKKDGHLPAAEAAMRLHVKLVRAAEPYFLKPTQDEYSTFQLCAKKDIEAAHVELDKHRGWKRVLGNIGLAILGLGILYLFALMKNRNLFFNKTDSSKLLECTENLIDNHAFKITENDPAV